MVAKLDNPIRLFVWVSREEKDAFDARCAENGTSMSDITRAFIHQYVAGDGPAQPMELHPTEMIRRLAVGECVWLKGNRRTNTWRAANTKDMPGFKISQTPFKDGLIVCREA